MSIKKIFLGTSKPLPELAAERLLDGKEALPDLGNILVAVPGNYARTKLQEYLVEFAPNGLLEPKIMTPGIMLHCGTAETKVPDQLENELIWLNVANKAAESGNFELLFPAYTGESNVSGTPFSRLRLELAAGGFSIADAGENLGARWEELCAIEQLYLEELESLGLSDRLAADRAAAENVEFFKDFDKIILCGITDVPKLLKKRIENIARTFPDKLEIWIYADGDKVDLFDETGSAIPEKWNNCAIEIPDFEQHVHCVETIEDAADRLLEVIAADGKLNFDETAVVLADPTMFPVFKRKFSIWAEEHKSKIELYDPSGIAVSELRLHKLGCALLNFCKADDEIEYTVELIKNPDMLDYLAHELKNNAVYILKQLDKFMLEVLPAEWQNATAFLEENNSQYPVVAKIFDLLTGITENYRKLSATDFLRDFFTTVYRHNKTIDHTLFRGVPFTSECNLLQESLRKLERSSISNHYDKKQLLEIFWKQLGNEKLSYVPEDEPLTVQGCLELPFISEKNIFFCGVNAEFFPDRISPATYLTDSIRLKSGIRCNQDTSARAASHLHSLCKMAQHGRNLQMIVMKKSIDNAPLSPSPLFFTGDLPEEELLKRSHLFFTKFRGNRKKPPASTSEYGAFTLNPELEYRTHPDYPDVPVMQVTAFHSYISNPLDYFMGSVMKMDEIDYSSKEPDDMDFGTLVHSVFERLGTDTYSTKEQYNANLQKLLNEVMREKYGKNPSPLLELVKENISQRLEYTSEILYDCFHKEHFIPLETEYSIGGDEKMVPLYFSSNDIPDVFVKGKIDRIEYCPETKTLRIIDFKTGKKKHIEDTLKSFSATEKSVKLTDLQMPLYAELLRSDKAFAMKHKIENMDEVSICCAYIVLPKNVSETELLECKSYTLEQIIPYVRIMVYNIVKQLKRWKNMEMSEKGLSSKYYKNILLPDVRSALPGIHWIETVPEEVSSDE